MRMLAVVPKVRFTGSPPRRIEMPGAEAQTDVPRVGVNGSHTPVGHEQEER